MEKIELSPEEWYVLVYPVVRHQVGLLLGRYWKRTVKLWKKRNPPKANGCYTCPLCTFEIAPADFSLDHIIPQSVDITLKLTLSNLQASHKVCNSNRAMLLDWPKRMVEWRSYEVGTFERDFADRVITQYQTAYREWSKRNILQTTQNT